MITYSDLARAATVAREVDLTTFGRETERPSRRTCGSPPLSGRAVSPIVRSFARASAPSRRNIAGSYLPLNQAKR